MRKTFCIVFAVAMLFILIATIVKAEKARTNYMILVNKQHLLPDNWEETVELETATNHI